MAALKRQAFLDALARPDPAIRLWLVTGPDEGVAEALARQAVAALSGGDPNMVRDLPAALLAEAPARLADEASSLSLFAERQLLWVRDGGDALAAAVALLLDAPQVAHPVVMLAAGAGRQSPLKAAASASARAHLVECWPLREREGEMLALDGARARGLVLARDEAALVWARSGADPSVLEQELDKLALAAGCRPDAPRPLAPDLLDALLPGASEPETDALVAALLRRDRAAVAGALGGLEPAGSIALLRTVARTFLTLAALAPLVASGADPAAAVGGHRPPLFWKHRDSMVEALRRWRVDEVARALDLLIAAERAIKTPGAAGDRLGLHALLRLALARGALGRGARRP